MSIATNQLVAQLKESDQDFEWYPTTNEIIQKVLDDLESKYGFNASNISILDVGAGNGKVLKALDKHKSINKLYAIELSERLRKELPPEIFVIGTNLFEQSLITKKINITFCNPPYSEYIAWMDKIIRESGSEYVYFVVPERWRNSAEIEDSIRFREAEVTSLGFYGFISSEDRQARAKVEVICVRLFYRQDDAFSRFFAEQFADLKEKFDTSKEQRVSEQEKKMGQLIAGKSYPETLVSLYQEELKRIQNNYYLVGQLDISLLEEFDVDLNKIKECLKNTLDNLKIKYWRELFDRLSVITNRLIASKREMLLNTLNDNAHVDFTIDNIYAIIIWVIKNANKHTEAQLIELYELMVDKANIKMYKSNEKVWAEDKWRYYDAKTSKNSHFIIDYRIVHHRVGGLSSSYGLSYELSERAADFIQDLMTIAWNFGFNCESKDEYARLFSYQGRKEWQSGATEEFYYTKNGKRILLFDVKAFKNGNLHIRFNQDFIRKWNVEFGRLKGWLKNPQEAAEELKDEKAAADFGTHFSIDMEKNNGMFALMDN